MGTLQGDQYTFWTISHSIILRLRNVSEKIVEKKHNLICNNFCFSKMR